MKMRTVAAVSVSVSLLGVIAMAQTSTNFKLEEYTFNVGGAPADGTLPSSTTWSITPASIGDSLAAVGLSSSTFGLDVGFGTAYPPPGEVAATCSASGPCLVFSDTQTLSWPAEASAGAYNLYRDLASNLSGLDFGQCEQQGLTVTTATDGDPVPSGDAFFYLVTMENRLSEEGTKGIRSNGNERQGEVCP